MNQDTKDMIKELEDQLQQAVRESSAQLSELRRMQEVIRDQAAVIVQLRARVKSMLEAEKHYKQIQAERDMLAKKLSESKKAKANLKQQFQKVASKG